MSYTRPDPAAADASWQGQTAYTRPDQDAADAAWATGNAATGFLATHFGGPSSPTQAAGFESVHFGAPALRMQSDGFLATQFGLAETLGYYFVPTLGSVPVFGLPQRDMVAQGFVATVFGGANTPTPALGFLATQFGEAVGYQRWHQRSLPPTTTFGTIFYAVDQEGEAVGSAFGQVGTPTSYQTVPQEIGWLTRAAGWRATAFGTPSTPSSTESPATGVRFTHFGLPFGLAAAQGTLGPVTRFGQPVGRTAHTAASLGPVAAFGALGGGVDGQAQGWRASNLGTPVARVTCAAAGRLHTRFGAPRASQSKTYRAWPCDARARFGRPAAVQRFNYPASSLGPLAVLGDPAGTFTSRARSLPPVARLGTPTRGGMQC